MQNIKKLSILGYNQMGQLRYNLLKKDLKNTLECKSILSTQKINELPIVTNDIEEALKGVEGVIIASENATHTHLEKCAEKGLHILTEKPIGNNFKEIKRAYEICKYHNVRLVTSWPKRYDEIYRQEIKDKLPEDWLHIRMVNRDPNTEIGNLIKNNTSQDVNMSLYLHNQMPTSVFAMGQVAESQLNVIDNSYSMLNYGDQQLVTLENSRCSPDGCDQRIEAFSRTQKLQTQNKTGETFTTRYEQAYKNQLIEFGQLLNSKDPMNFETIAKEQDCLNTSLITEALFESFYTKKMVYMNNSTPQKTEQNLSFIGYGGRFQNYMNSLISTRKSEISLQTLGNPSTQGDFSQILQKNSTNSVYICNSENYNFQISQALQNNKNVLCQKPVQNIGQVVRQAETCGKVFMVGFQRRFDEEFLKARNFVLENLANIESIEFFQREPTPDDQNCLNNLEDLKEVIASNGSHDLDFLNFMLPQWRFETFSVIGLDRSGYDIQGFIENDESFGSQNPQRIEISMSLQKDQSNYSNLVFVKLKGEKQARQFGYDSYVNQNRNEPFYNVHREAFLKQFEYFQDIVDGKTFDRKLLEGYQKTFGNVEKCQNFAENWFGLSYSQDKQVQQNVQW